MKTVNLRQRNIDTGGRSGRIPNKSISGIAIEKVTNEPVSNGTHLSPHAVTLLVLIRREGTVRAL